MSVEARHRQLTQAEYIEMRIEMCNDMFSHLVEMHGLTPKQAANAVLRDLASMFSAGVSVDAPHATSVDGDASHTSTAPAEPPQPTRPDPGITERKPRR